MSKKTEQMIVRAAMRRYEELQEKNAVMFADVMAGNKPISMTENAAALIRACRAHAKATKPKGPQR